MPYRRNCEQLQQRRAVRRSHHRPLRFEPLEDRRLLATYTVDTLQDVVDANDGVLSLREAVTAANATTAADGINFGPALTAGGPAAIVLTQGEILISRSLTVTGPGSGLLTIDASGSDPTPDVNNLDGSRIFRAQGTAISLSISGLRLTGGDVSLGGAVSASATASLQDLIVERNSGGGVFVQGNATITDCVFQENVTIGNGGGLAVNGNLTIVDSIITRNTAGDLSGGIDQWQGTVLVDNCEITFNTAGNGGGIQTAGPTVEIRNSTITGNRAIGGDFGGGGLFNRDGWGNQLLRIVASTIRDNVSESEGGVGQFTMGGGGLLNHASGDVFIVDSVISGNTAVGITRVSGGGIHNGHVGGRLYIDGSRVENNQTSGKGGGIYGRGWGFLSDTTLSGNQASGQGGGVWIGGGAALVRSTINDNHTTGTSAQGGGLFAGGISTITDSNVTGNSTLGDQARGGGGYFTTNSTVTLARSTVSGNQTHGTNADGGGIYSRARAILDDSTVSGNKTSGAQSDGGGVFSNELFAVRSTIAMNSVSDAGSAGGGVAANVVQLTNTIVALNSSSATSPDIKTQSTVSASSSLIGNTSGIPFISVGGNLLNVAPHLGPLADNGGPTMTHALLVGSPAIDAGIPGWTAGVGGVPAFDQRGTPFGRVVDGDASGGARIDIGAFERQTNEIFHLVVDTLADENDGDYSPGDFSLREAIALANLNPGADTISFAPALTAGGPATIVLTMGQLVIDSDLTITGSGRNLLSIDASGNDSQPGVFNGSGSRVFEILLRPVIGWNVTLGGMTLTGGDVNGHGGAILAAGNLTLEDVLITHNRATSGGAVYTTWSLTVADSAIVANRAFPSGGGIYALGSAVVVLSSSLITGNVAHEGGGVYVEDTSVTIDGSTIANNFVSTDLIGRGAGIFAVDANVLGTNVVIQGNIGSVGSGVAAVRSTLTFNSSRIDGNHGSDGGGIYVDDTMGGVTLNFTSMSGNSAVYGGAIYSQNSPVVINDSVIDSNHATTGGGVFVRDDALRVVRSRVTGNTAIWNGGGLVSYSTLESSAMWEVSDSLIDQNTAGERGGGIYASGTFSPIIAGTTFHANTANWGGAVAARDVANLGVRDSTISGNHAVTSGGGLFASDSGVFLLRNTVTENSAASNPDGTGAGGGITAYGNTNIFLDHTIVASNHDPSELGPDAHLSPLGFNFPTLTAVYSLVGDNRGTNQLEAPVSSPDANGNLIGGPVHGVIDPLLGPLTFNGGPTLTHALLPGSPALDAGDPNAVAGMSGVPEFDQRGLPFVRVANGDDVPEARIDMGAFEWQPNPLTGDYNFDGVVDAADAAVWRKTVGSTVDLRADGDGDGDVDADDHTVWAANFGNAIAFPLSAVTSVTWQPPALRGVSARLDSATHVSFVAIEAPAEPRPIGVLVDASLNGTSRRAVGSRLALLDRAAADAAQHDDALLAWLKAEDAWSRDVNAEGIIEAENAPHDTEPSTPVALASAFAIWDGGLN